jgi:competence protein ComGC
MMKKTLNQSEKKQSSMIEFLVVLVIVAVLMKLLLDFFWSQQQNITNAAFIGLAQSFTSKVNVVHAQWLMDEQPDVVVLSQLNSTEKQYVNVNSTGWIDNDHISLACHNIWLQTLVMPLQVVKSVVTAIEIHNEEIKNGRLCRYSIVSGEFFDYRSDTGKVKQVN